MVNLTAHTADIELNSIATAIAALEAEANKTQRESEARGWDGPAAVSVTRYAEVSFLDVIQDIIIDAALANHSELKDAASAAYNEYRTRPGAVTTKEVLAVCSTLRDLLG